MTPKLALIFSLAVVGFSAPAFAAQDPIETGYWEAQTSWLGLSGSTERWCVKPKDVARFLSGPSNHIYHCTYPVSTAQAGAIHFDGSCVDKKGQEIKLRGDGQYTPHTVHMAATGSAKVFGLDIAGEASVDAHFVSPTCPPDARDFS